MRLVTCLPAAGRRRDRRAAALSPLTTGQTAVAGRAFDRDHHLRPARNEPMTGRVYVALSRDNKRTPIQQAAPTGSPLFSSAVEGLKPGAVGRDRRRRRRAPGRKPARTFRPAITGCSPSSTSTPVSLAPTAASSGCTWINGRDRTGSVARQPVRRTGADHVRPEVDRADQADGRQGDPAGGAAGRHRARQAHPDEERDPEPVVGPADLLRRDRAAAEGLRPAPGRVLPGELRARATSRCGRRAGSAPAAASMRSGWRPARRA